MKNDITLFIKELKRHYSFRFLIMFISFIFLLLCPIIFIRDKIRFDAVQFSNTYLSNVFTAFLIGITLQIVEVYKSTHVAYSKLYAILNSTKELLVALKKDIVNNNQKLYIHNGVLNEYIKQSLNNFTADNTINESICNIYNSIELQYIIESVKNENSLSDSKKIELLKRIDYLQESLTKTIHML